MLTLFILFISVPLSFVVGTLIGSYFTQRKSEDLYFFRTYQLYKEGKVDRFTVIMMSIVNTSIGGIVVVPFMVVIIFYINS